MENVTLYNPTNIFFGKDIEEKVGEEIKKYGNKILLHYGEGSIKESGLYSKILEILNREGVQLIELGGVEKNPKLELVERGIEFCKKNNIDFILAVGGGSVVDSAKAIAVGAKLENNLWDLFESKEEQLEALPIGVVLTNPGSGSEASNYTVLTNESEKEKRSYISNCLYPKFAFLNPELCFTLSDKQIGSAISEIISHLVEKYILNIKNIEITNRLIEGTLKTVINNAYKVIDNKNSYDGFAEIIWSAAVAQNDILSTNNLKSLELHCLENQICAKYDVDNGEVLSIIYPAIMKYLATSHGDRLSQLGRRVFKVVDSSMPVEELAIETAKKLEEFYKSINMPIRLSELGIKEDELLEMADKVTENGDVSINEFVTLNRDDIYNIYKLAF